MRDYKIQDDIQQDKAVNELPFNDKYKNHYISNRDESILEIISKKIKENKFYDPISLHDFLPHNKTLFYIYQKFKKYEIGCKDITFMVAPYEPCACGNSYFLWKEDDGPDKLRNRQEVINSINVSLPKYFPRSHKKE